MSDLMPEFADAIASAEFEPAESVQDTDSKAPRRTRSDKGRPRGPRGTGTSSTRDKKLAEDLLGPWALAIKALAIPMPTVAAVMAQRGDKTTNAIVALASPKLKEKLAKVSKLGPGTDLAETFVMLVVAVLMDTGKLDANAPLGMFTGVTDLYEQTHQTDVQPDNVTPFPSAPGGYAPPPFFPGMSS